MRATVSSARSNAWLSSLSGFCFILSFTGMSAVDFERFLKKGHVREAQILYWLLVLALATLAAQFVMAFLYF